MDTEQLGDYTLLKPLGLGPFGAVFLAEHRFIKRAFALKVLPDGVTSDPQFYRRFEAEVAEISSLDHPHLAKIHHASIQGDRAYLVTDPIVDSLGATIHLERFMGLRGKTLSEEEQVRLLRGVAETLDYGHEQGVIHGGLKPSNVLVAPDGKGVKFIVSDWGVARLIGEGRAFLLLAEKIGKALMLEGATRPWVQAFHFLAPEQKWSPHEPATAAADAYAFGALVYYVLLHKIPEGAFDLPSKLLPQHRFQWDSLIQRCLHPNPHARPQKLVAALDELVRASAPVEMKSLSEIEPKVEHVLQMAFAFEDASAKVEAPVEAPRPKLMPAEIARPEYESDPAAIFQRDLLVSHYEPKKVEVSEVEPLLTEMAVIPAGSYVRGSPEGSRDEMPRHAITLESFALDIHPVTNEQFIRFLQAMGGEKDKNNNDIIRLREARIKRSNGKLVIESGYAKHPVVGVSWYGATAYARWVGKRLPTEAEWEAAACGGGEGILYPTGADIERTQANFFSSDTTAVASYAPNPFGLYDMAGNVYDWCQDWYAYNYYDASLLEPTSPPGPQQGVYRVLRGGCWKSLKEDLRCSHRHRNNPGAANGTYGFRCAADVVQD